MLFTRKWLVVSLLIVAGGLCHPLCSKAATLVDTDQYQQLSDGRLRVHFLPQDRLVAAEYLDWAVQYRPRPQWMAQRALTGLEVYVAPSVEEFTRLSGGRLPEWGVACAIPGTDVVIVRSPRIVELWREDPREILYHEITHIFLDQMMGGATVPRWFHEGYAQYVSQMWGLDSFLEFSVAILADRVFKLNDLDKGFPAGENQARLAYLQSYTVVEFMFSRWNDAQMQLLFERWREVGQLDPALRSSLGLTLAQMEQLWLDWAGARYGWLKLLTSATLMWIAAAVLFVVIYVVRRRRYKLKLKAMQLREARLAQSITPAGPGWSEEHKSWSEGDLSDEQDPQAQRDTE